jgi:hypothetical protein
MGSKLCYYVYVFIVEQFVVFSPTIYSDNDKVTSVIFVPEIVFPRLPMKQSLIMCVLGVEFNCIPVKSFSMFFVRKLCSMLVDIITEGRTK